MILGVGGLLSAISKVGGLGNCPVCPCLKTLLHCSILLWNQHCPCHPPGFYFWAICKNLILFATTEHALHHSQTITHAKEAIALIWHQITSCDDINAYVTCKISWQIEYVKLIGRKVAWKLNFTQTVFLHERRFNFWTVLCAPRKLSRGPQFENHWSNKSAYYKHYYKTCLAKG